MTQKYPIKLDVNKVLQEKLPGNKIPGFLINWLAKIIHQDELNEILAFGGEAEGHLFAKKSLEYFNIRLNVIGEENIPQEGKFIFASNHPLGGLDGVALTAFLGEKFDGKIKVQVNDILMNVSNLEPVFLPVNKHGGQAKEAIRKTNEAYESDNQLLVFPAGLCSRKQKGKIEDLTWRKAFITKAIEYNRPVIPVFFNEINSSFFYNLSLLRKRIGIKANIEMLFLPNEMFKKKNTVFTFYIGKPILPSQFDHTRTQQWADYVKEIVYQTGKFENGTNSGRNNSTR
ncbi:MAG: 1-acyl-sn-glycerol-3-phosphate acyltransferase [Candidatus Azobacteroides sp.]|nr:1-acyl-sn-glycerol-3-phosphate acyltransferase [Candidatus Azobacteroides sp.]